MADRNLTNALFELKDDKRSRRPSPAPPRNPRSRLPYGPRAFDTFYSFGFALLALALLGQLVAMAAFG